MFARKGSNDKPVQGIIESQKSARGRPQTAYRPPPKGLNIPMANNLLSSYSQNPLQPILKELQPLISKTLLNPDSTELDRQNLHVRTNFAKDMDSYQHELEQEFNTENCLMKHKITPNLRARMIDWMIEVLTNFKCDDQTFFLAVSILDRYFKGKNDMKEISDLHMIGVTAMFISSKTEDIYPLKMKMVYEKISHKKLPISRILETERDIMNVLNYRVYAPTSLDFLRYYMKEVLDITVHNSTTTSKKDKEKEQPVTTNEPKHPHTKLIEKMAVYLAKMAVHNIEVACKVPSLQAVGSMYVALKICEQLKKTQLITNEIVFKLVGVSKAKEEDIIEISQKILYLAQNFEKEFPGLENLKKTHFVNITQLL